MAKGIKDYYKGSKSPSGNRKDQNRGRDFRKDGNKEQRRGSSERRFTKSPSGRTQQERSASRAKGSPIRMTGCVRCSSSNHKGEVCPRFDYWKGSRCKHCFYLHDHNLCPLFTKDKVDKKTFVNKRERPYIAPKDNDNSYRNAYQIEVQNASEELLQDKRQSVPNSYIPVIPQPGSMLQENICSAKN